MHELDAPFVLRRASSLAASVRLSLLRFPFISHGDFEF